MNGKKRLKLCLACILLLLAVLLGYKVYLIIYETDYQALNADSLDRIEATLGGGGNYRFTVIGNIRNSMRIFERRIAPLIRSSGSVFMISVGNAVYDGAEGKFRLLYRGLGKLGIPYLLTAGHNEVEDFGAERFYRHFGPYFFAFHLPNSSFIFLDSTGKTSWKWQMRWLRQQLALAADYPYRFVFMGNAMLALPGIDPEDSEYVVAPELSRKLQQLFSRYQVTAVFSAGYPVYHQSVVGGVRYIVSGCGGGLFLDAQKHYQFVTVEVAPDGVNVSNVMVPDRQGTFRARLETLKLYLHSFFYMSFSNSLLILCLIGLIGLRVYSLLLRQEHLYRDFSIDGEALSRFPLRVGMFTNTYLPFIGGVPLSIERLYRGLVRLGTRVQVFAPAYRQQDHDCQDSNVFRCTPLFHTRPARAPVANIFSPRIGRSFKKFDCDLVHVHHPFWLGGKGLRLAKKHGKPVVFTYHTRLERYTHYIPLPGTPLKNLVVHMLIKRFANRCDAIITPTSSTEEYLRNLGVSALIETIPTGIALKEYRRWSPQQVLDVRGRYVATEERLLISVSRLAKEKNLDFLIDGLAKVKKLNHSPFKCLLVGEGPEKARLQDKVALLGLSDHILFAGSMPPHAVVGCYLAADCFVFASTSETQGMVLLEAMAAGCPVVAVRSSGVYDLVKDGYNGFKVAESTDSWARAVSELLADEKRLELLAGNSREFVKDYSIEKMAEKVLELYRRVVIVGKSRNA